jgi:hypothetical protein
VAVVAVGAPAQRFERTSVLSDEKVPQFATHRELCSRKVSVLEAVKVPINVKRAASMLYRTVEAVAVEVDRDALGTGEIR